MRYHDPHSWPETIHSLRWCLIAVGWTAGMLVGTASCDRSSSEPRMDHPAADRARAFLQAVQYGDETRAYRHHLESTERGVYCQSESFQKVLERTRRQKTEADCKGARRLSNRRRAALADDAELLVQILRFTCEQPRGDCRDYARRVFMSQFPRSPLWKRLDDFELKRLESRDGRATLYVDLIDRTSSEPRIFHRSLTMRSHDGEWYVSEAPRRLDPDDD